MAKGRMLNNKITKNKAIHELSCDTSRLGFTWLIPFADREGRTYGDPAIVKSMVFPRRADVTIEDVAGYLEEWKAAGLIERYEVNGEAYIQFPEFDRNQPNLRKDREPVSEIPPNPADKSRQTSGSAPDDDRHNLSEIKNKEKGREVNLNPKEMHDDDRKSSKKLSKTAVNTRKFLDIIGLTFSSNDQADEFDHLVQIYGIELVLEITKWVQTKEVSNMSRALSMIRTAAPRWEDRMKLETQPRRSRRSNLEVYLDGNES